LLAAEAGLKEIQLAKERGQLISLSDVEKLLTKLIIDTRSQILTMGLRLAPELVGETSRLVIQTKIDNQSKQILLQLAKRAGWNRTGKDGCTEADHVIGSPRIVGAA
jgi:hypothetical protein